MINFAAWNQKNRMKMKKIVLFGVSALLLLSSCGTYEGAGAATGAQFGSIIGSAIGGITGGWRGSDVGSLVGMAGGAVVGAAVGRAADKKEEQRYLEHRAQVEQRTNRATAYIGRDESGFDPYGRGDDRITFDNRFAVSSPVALEIRNARLLDASRDGKLVRGEEARMVFEIYNPTSEPAYGVLPMVAEVTGNKHIHISENVMVEGIGAGQSIRYTAMIKADSGLKNGEAVIRISVLQGNKELQKQAREFYIETCRR